MQTVLPKELAVMQAQVEAAARTYGLDFFPTFYEVLDYDEMNMVGSYMGFPVRYPHWKWGMEYDKMSKTHEYGVSRVYEMVINNDPCYAYLMESNTMVDQKLVMCHVTAHNDFFKNNLAFQHTNRRMIDEMANHATRIRRYMDWYGVEVVETFIDQVLSLENCIDYHSPFITRTSKKQGTEEDPGRELEAPVLKIPSNREYMERYVNPDDFVESQKKQLKERREKQRRFPAQPERDVVRFLMTHAPLLRWQRDVIDILWEEAQYFAPQAMTKIMNEGWASYWHSKLMTEKVMDSSEVVDFADRHSAVVAMQQGQLNPYRLGLELFRDIEERWNMGRFGLEWEQVTSMAERRLWDKKLGLGREKIFSVRKIYTDITFIDEFFTHDFCKKHGYFAYGYDKKKQEYLIESKDFIAVKQKMLASLTNLGQPSISVLDANYENRSEILLEHTHDGVDLDMQHAKETLKNVTSLWTRPAHILTKQDDRLCMLSFDGHQFKEKIIDRAQS
ncbi:MAG: SpoVR family protein [Myxococcota bacterium]